MNFKFIKEIELTNVSKVLFSPCGRFVAL